MDFVKILYQTHVDGTIHRPCTHIEVNVEKCVLQKSQEEYDICWKNAYKKFQQTKQLYGSVDVNPEIWANICYSKVLDAIKESKSTVKLPNGCCVSKDCSINIFYKLFIEELSENN